MSRRFDQLGYRVDQVTSNLDHLGRRVDQVIEQMGGLAIQVEEMAQRAEQDRSQVTSDRAEFRSTFQQRGLSSNRTESHVKAETLTEKAFQKAVFSPTATYQLASKLFGTAIKNGVSMV